MRALVASAAVALLAAPLAAQQTITCSSYNGRTHFCRADTSNGVILTHERSNNLCQQGSTWHYSRNGITVSGGCSAVFQLGGSNSSGNGGNGGNGYNSGQAAANQDGYPNNNGNGYNNNNGNSSENGNSNGNGYNQNSRYGDSTGRAAARQDGYPQSNQNGSGYNNGSNQNGYSNGSGSGYSGNGSGTNQNGYNNRNGQNGDNNGQNGYNGSNQNGYGQNRTAVTIPADTRMVVRFQQNLDPNAVNQGDRIPATLVNDVAVNGRVVFPAGTPIEAHVVSAAHQPLDIRLDSISYNNATYRLQSSSVHGLSDSQQGQNSDNSGNGNVVGAILGAVEGNKAQIPSGTQFTFRLTAPAVPAGMGR